MKAKAFVEQHPLPVYLGVFISAVTAATTLTIHFKDSERASTVATAQADAAKQRLADDARIGQLEQSLASIPRLVGSQVRYLPVAKITISPAQARRLPANEHYFDTDRM